MEKEGHSMKVTNLKLIRMTRGITQLQMSGILNISLSNYQKKEKNMRTFTVTECEIMSKYMGVTPMSLFY
jgi:transcriptional regulator with XRE-family HTH domain